MKSFLNKIFGKEGVICVFFDKIKTFFAKHIKSSNVFINIKGFFYKSRYFWQKLGFTLLTLFLTIIICFVIIKSMPADTIHQYALKLQNELKISYEDAYRQATMMLNYDPNQDVFTSFFSYLGGLFRGNLGSSLFKDVTANEIIAKYLPWTLLISSVSLFLSFLLGTTMGIRMARKRKGVEDTIYSGLVTVSSSIPDYLLGIILLMVLGSYLGWFPTYGAYDLDTLGPFFPYVLSILHHAFLPILTYTIAQFGNWVLLAKGSAVAVLGDDYVNAAIIRGLPKRVIERKYLKKNAMLPLVTSLIISLAYLFGGSAVMEGVFAYPGIGRAFTEYLGARDYYIVQGLFVFLSFLIIIGNLLADLLCGLLDPRIRKS